MQTNVWRWWMSLVVAWVGMACGDMESQVWASDGHTDAVIVSPLAVVPVYDSAVVKTVTVAPLSDHVAVEQVAVEQAAVSHAVVIRQRRLAVPVAGRVVQRVRRGFRLRARERVLLLPRHCSRGGL